MEQTTSSESVETPALTYSVPESSDPNQPLTRFDAAAVALKILGLYFLILTVPAFVSVPLTFFSGPAGPRMSDLGIAAGGSAPYLLIGLVLILWGERVARWITPSSFQPVHARPLVSSAIRLQAIAFSVAGIVLLGWAFPHLMRGIGSYFYYARRNPAEHPDFLDVFRPEFIQFAGQAIFGLWLFLGSKGLAVYWHRVRGGGPAQTADR